MNFDEVLRDYARKLVARVGHQNGNPNWDVIAESWEGDEELTLEQLDRVYELWATAKVTVSWDDE